MRSGKVLVLGAFVYAQINWVVAIVVVSAVPMAGKLIRLLVAVVWSISTLSLPSSGAGDVA
jgi:hypothetical protein